MSTRQKLLKISLFVHKKEGISDEEFHRYWTVEHPKHVKKCRPFMERCYRYNQVHMTPEMRKEAESIGLNTLDYDGSAEFWVESFDDWKAMIDHPEGIMTLRADEAVFAKHPYQITYGYEELIIGNSIQFDKSHAI